MNIYRQTINLLERHNERFHIDLKRRMLRVGRKVIIDDGKPVDKHGEWGIYFFPDAEHAIIAEIEKLYDAYKHSVPGYNEQSHYFKALKYEQLSQEECLSGGSRILEQFKLEYYLLAAICQNALSWWMGDKFFWRSQNDPDLVILREWIEKDIIKPLTL